MLATIEDILGLPPMSTFDERAAPMWKLFGTVPNLQPYEARTPTVTPFGDPGALANQATAAMASASARWDFAEEDAAPEIALNRAIWKSVNGSHSRMPRPRHTRIIGTRPTDEPKG